MHKAVDAALVFLVDSAMVVEIGEHLGPTDLGTLVSRLYIDPRSAAMIVSTLGEKNEYSDRGLLQIICNTPDMPKLYVRNADMATLDRMIDACESELWVPRPSDEAGEETYYRALKTAMLLSDWTDELSDAKICERYSIGPGDVYGMVESVNWLLHASAELSRMLALGFPARIREYEVCMKHGIRRELLPLVRLRGIGRVRARLLYNNGITSPEGILAAGMNTVRTIIGQGITEQIFSQLQRTGKDQAKRGNGNEALPVQSTLFRFG
jgi:helicase